VENLLASTLHIYSFSTYYTVLWTKNGIKSFSKINSAIMKNLQLSVCPVVNWKVGVLLDYTAVSLHLLPALWGAVQAKNSIRNTPVSTALIQVLYGSHNTCYTNYHLCSKGERNGAKMLSFIRNMMQALELLRLAKRHVSGQSDILNSEKSSQ